MCDNPLSAQIGNELIDSVMETKLLDFNLDKSCYIVTGDLKAQEPIRESFSDNPLKLSGKDMKEANEEKYLGDFLSSKGLGESILVTINSRLKKVSNALMEIRAVVEDSRAMVIGGIITGLEIWEISVLPYLLNNADTWCNLPSKAVQILEDLQNQFLRNLLATPRSCPTPALLWETGTLSMENRIVKKKLLLYHHLLHLSHDSLAWQVAEIQVKLSLPGLIQECGAISEHLHLPEAISCSKSQWKKQVNLKIKEKNKNDILETIARSDYKKLDLEELKAENFERKDYISKLNMSEARTKFAIRTKMTKSVKLNYKNDPVNKNSLWKCEDCSYVDSQEHILWCQAYEQFRTNKDLSDDKDLVRYFQQVLQYRD